MRKICLSLLGIVGLALAGLALVPIKAPAQQTGATEVICNKQFVVNAAGATSMTVAVAGVPNQSITFCGFLAAAGAASSTIQIVSGTGANCNTNQVIVIPPIILAINGILPFNAGRGIFGGAGGASLCYNIVGAGPTSIVIYYFQ